MARSTTPSTPAYTAESIQEKEFLEAIRMRPGMYIGDNRLHGLHHLALETLDNAVDEAMAGFGDCITVFIEKDGAMRIADQGRGIPIDWKPEAEMSALTLVFLKSHAGGKFGGADSAYSSSGGLHGIGLKAVNAMSEYVEVEVRRHGLAFRQRFEKGGATFTPVEIFDAAGKRAGAIDADTRLTLDKKGLATGLEVGGRKAPVKADPGQVTGTTVRFRPNRAWFSKEMEWSEPGKNVPWDAHRLETRLRQIAFLYPGVRIEFTDERVPRGERRMEVFLSEKGLEDFIKWANEDEQPLHKPIVFKADVPVEGGEGGKPGTIQVEVALQYAGEETTIYSFVNAIPTPLGGTHVAAFKAALTKAVRAFADDKKLLKGKEDFKGDDVLLGLTAIISLRMINLTPQFLSQTKESLTSPEANGPVFSTVYAEMSAYLGEAKNYGTGKLIVQQAVAAASGREAAAQARSLVIKRSAMDAGAAVLGKLSDVQRRGGDALVPVEHTALFLVEGDSAGGSCKQGRDSRYHAILPLRGKILNVAKGAGGRKAANREATLNEALKNKEIASIVAAIGAGIAQAFDMSTMRYGRVVILSDADVDGAHIACLLTTLFWRLMRPLIEAGRLYIARPPLYQVRSKDGRRTAYAYTEAEREELVASWGETVTQRYKGLGEMNPEQLRATVFALPDGAAKNSKAHAEAGELTLKDFARHELQVTAADVHDTTRVVELLMGDAVGPRKEWLMSQPRWDEEE